MYCYGKNLYLHVSAATRNPNFKNTILLCETVRYHIDILSPFILFGWKKIIIILTLEYTLKKKK